jgi:hypothetical protein
MKVQRREQGDDGLWRLRGDDGEAVVDGDLGVSALVKPTLDTNEGAAAGEAARRRL